jgi:hypothetical protein
LSKELTERFGQYLCGNKFRIGIAQKAINLYLKFLWCMKEIPTPPHCTIDGRIISTLGLTDAWTKLDSIQEYKQIIEKCKEQAGKNRSAAEWELETWPDEKQE